MAFKIKIQPADIQFQSEEYILNDALKQNVSLEHSCKTGECGTCSAQIISGEIENEKGEVAHKGDFILTCQSKARTNATLKVNYYPQLSSFKLQTLPCKIASFEYVTDDIVVIKLRFPPSATFNFLPGQYVDLIFKGIKRSYSIANAQQLSSGIELHIRKVPNGKMSDVIFSDIKENELMRIEGPKGTFFIRKDDKPLILLAGGTGIAPVKAMLENLIETNDKREVFIYWGMNFINSFYLTALSALSTKNSNIHYTPVLSGNEQWQGRMGLVHQAVCDDFDSLKEYQVYACGSPLMINAAMEFFLLKGLCEDAFFSDAFTAAK